MIEETVCKNDLTRKIYEKKKLHFYHYSIERQSVVKKQQISEIEECIGVSISPFQLYFYDITKGIT